MRLEGTLDAFSLPDIFQLLSFTKKSGALHLRRGATAGVVHFTSGSVTGAVADQSRHGLAKRLAGASVVTDDALAAAVDRAADDTNIGVARALRDEGAVDETTLHGFVAEHTVDAVFDLLRWPDGDFALAVDEANPDDLGVALPVEDVVTEARRRLDAWQSYTAVIPSPDAVPALVPRPEADPAVSREEWSLLGLVDGRRPVVEIVGLTGRGEFAVVSALAGLVERGLLAVRMGAADDAVATLARRQALLTRLSGSNGHAVASSGDTDGASPSDDDPDPAGPGGGSPQPAAVTAAPSVPYQAPVAPAAPAPPASPVTPVTESDLEPVGATSGPTTVADTRLVPSIGSPVAGLGSAVTPVRAEPFLPRRLPDHPEDQALNAPVLSTVGPVVGSTAVAADAAPSPHIERDPSVNKSLLLRLIAGVRGL